MMLSGISLLLVLCVCGPTMRPPSLCVVARGFVWLVRQEATSKSPGGSKAFAR